MGNFIYWQSCNEFVTERLPSGKEVERQVTRKLMCSHPAVEQVWFTGYVKDDPNEKTIGARLEILLNDGTHNSFDVTEGQFKSGLIPEAERFLALLPGAPISTALTEIKKWLYKNKPTANFIHCRKIKGEACLVYGCNTGRMGPPNLFFEVPVTELGEGLFKASMEAQLLIRYIVQPEMSKDETNK